MANILEATTGDLLRVTTYKHHENISTHQFVNTYEVQLRDTMVDPESELETLVDAIVTFEKAITYSYIIYDRATVSTWEADTTPYDGNEFVSYDYGGYGSILVGSYVPAPLNVVLYLRRTVSTGRPGKLHIRGAAHQEDYHAPAGTLEATSASDAYWGAEIPTAVSTNLGAYLPSGTSAFQLVMVGRNSAGATTVRPVKNIEYVGYRNTKRTHRYFDKGA